MKIPLSFVFIAFLFLLSGYGQNTEFPDTLKYAAESKRKDRIAVEKGQKQRYYYDKHLIILNPDSTCRQLTYSSKKQSQKGVLPVVNKCFWLKDKNKIYLYKAKSFDPAGWTAVFTMKKRSLIYHPKRSPAKPVKIKSPKSFPRIRIFGSKIIRKYIKIN